MESERAQTSRVETEGSDDFAPDEKSLEVTDEALGSLQLKHEIS